MPSKTIHSPIKSFGGKGNFHSIISSKFPQEYTSFIEPFAGSAVIALNHNKEKCSTIINDLNKNIYSFFKVVQDKEMLDRMKEKLDVIFYSEDIFKDSLQWLKEAGQKEGYSVEDRAYHFFIVNRMSFSGNNKSFGKNMSIRRSVAKSVSDLFSAIDGLYEVHQRLQHFIILNRDAVELIEYYDNPEYFFYCYDKDTEVLTSNGWKLFKDVDIDKDLFLSREPNTKKIEWVNAINYINYNYDGKMYHYEGKEIDLMTTPNHKLFIEQVSENKTINGNETFDTAENLYGKRFNFITGGGKWDKKSEENIKIYNTEYNFKKFAYLFGIWCTDGSAVVNQVNKKDGKEHINVSISQSKEHIRNKIITTLNDLNITYNDNGDSFVLHVGDIQKYLSTFGSKMKRYVPDIIKNASKDVILSCLEGIIDGDGNSDASHLGLFGSRRIAICLNKRLMGDIQEMLFKVGFSSGYRIVKATPRFLKDEDRWINGNKEYYVISIKQKTNINHYTTNQKQHGKIYNNEKWVDYNDEVYCVELEKWNTLLVRRNGKILWCGNCDSPYHHSTRTAARYEVDMDNEQQKKYLEVLVKSSAKLLVSGYDCPLYDEVLVKEFGWNVFYFDVNTVTGTNKSKVKTECLWYNYEL